jgi:hypothetical protein
MESMDMSEAEGMDMVEEQDHLTNHQLGDDGMNMVGSHKVEMEGMDTVDSVMGEDRTTKFEVVEREPEDMVLVRH